MFINKVLLYGNITRDIELKSTPSGAIVCSFSIATNRTWKDKSGAKQEDAQFHNCVAWGRTAELIHQFLGKGSGIYIEGRLQTRKWTDKSNVVRYTTEIVVEQMQFGPKASGAPKQEKKAGELGDLDEVDLGGDGTLPAEEEIKPEDIPF